MRKYGQPEEIKEVPEEQTRKIAEKQDEGKTIDEAISETESEQQGDESSGSP